MKSFDFDWVLEFEFEYLRTPTEDSEDSYMKEASKIYGVMLKIAYAETPELIPNTFLVKFYPILM